MLLADEVARNSGAMLVWDRFIRLFHWSLVAAILTAVATALLLPATYIDLHIVSGSTAAVLVGARIVWGFLGPAHARFSAFLRKPAEILAHIGELGRGHAARHVGHNPLGGAMVALLLGAVGLLATTGVIALGGTLKSGPAAFATTFAIGEAARGLHQLFSYTLVGMVFLHLGGVIFESWRTRENLAAALIHGRKQRRGGDVRVPLARSRPIVATTIVAILLLGAAAIVLTLRQLPALGVPAAALDPLYARECGDCHRPFHPSLAPATTWKGIMDHLDRHFGEDASLDSGETEKIRAYLVANAAESYDTKAANRLRRTDPSDPLSITATPFWRRTHASIPQAVFAAKSIGGKSVCGACHADSGTGQFHPANIVIPEQATP